MEIQCNYLAMYKKGTELMVCSHCPRPRPIKRQIKKWLVRIVWKWIVWKCSYNTETDTNTDSHWVLCKVICVCLSLHVCLGIRCCLGIGHLGIGLIRQNFNGTETGLILHQTLHTDHRNGTRITWGAHTTHQGSSPGKVQKWLGRSFVLVPVPVLVQLKL